MKILRISVKKKRFKTRTLKIALKKNFKVDYLRIIFFCSNS